MIGWAVIDNICSQQGSDAEPQALALSLSQAPCEAPPLTNCLTGTSTDSWLALCGKGGRSFDSWEVVGYVIAKLLRREV